MSSWQMYISPAQGGGSVNLNQLVMDCVSKINSDDDKSFSDAHSLDVSVWGQLTESDMGPILELLKSRIDFFQFNGIELKLVFFGVEYIDANKFNVNFSAELVG